MSRKIPLSSLKQINEINLTPLMDLTFILLITFIITFPLIEQGISVNLPKGDAEEVSADDARTVTIDKAGVLYFDDFELSYEDLVLRLGEVGKLETDVTVMVRADESINYGSVVRVLKVLHDSNIYKMALVTESEE